MGVLIIYRRNATLKVLRIIIRYRYQITVFFKLKKSRTFSRIRTLETVAIDVDSLRSRMKRIDGNGIKIGEDVSNRRDHNSREYKGRPHRRHCRRSCLRLRRPDVGNDSVADVEIASYALA